MKKIVFVILTLILTFTFTALMSVSVFAAEPESVHTGEAVVAAEDAGANENDVLSTKAIAAAIAVGVVGAAGAIGMAFAIAKSTDNIARQPEMASKINSAMMLGLVFIETAIIYALIVAILIIFVL